MNYYYNKTLYRYYFPYLGIHVSLLSTYRLSFSYASLANFLYTAEHTVHS